MTRDAQHPYRNGITTVVAAVVIALGAALGACSPRDRRTPDDTLVIAIESAMTTPDPRYAITSYDGKLAKLVCSGLTALDSQNMEPRLELASKVEMLDERTWDVWIRPDAKFSDGSPVTAADVAGTWAAILAKDSDSLFHKSLGEKVIRVDVIAPLQTRFHLKGPLSTFYTDLDFGIFKTSAGVPASGKVIGAGPYILREITSRHAMLDANPHYIGGVAKLPHLEVKFVRDAAARLLMLVGGSADLLQNATRLDLINDVAERPRVRIESSPSVVLTYLLLNNDDPTLKDLRVRQAIALAIDRPAIIAAKFGGRAQLANGLIAPFHWAYAPGITSWSYDKERAKRLLDEAGLKDPDGDGPRMRASFVYKTSSDAFRVAVARVIAAQLADVGLDVEVRSFEFATFFADVKKGTYQLASMQTADISGPDFYFTYFHSSWIPSSSNPDGYNRWRYRSPEVDRLTEEGRRELDPAKRKVIYDRVQTVVAADVPIVPLWHEDNVVLTNVDVQGYLITPNARLVGLRNAWKRP